MKGGFPHLFPSVFSFWGEKEKESCFHLFVWWQKIDGKRNFYFALYMSKNQSLGKRE